MQLPFKQLSFKQFSRSPAFRKLIATSTYQIQNQP